MNVIVFLPYTMISLEVVLVSGDASEKQKFTQVFNLWFRLLQTVSSCSNLSFSFLCLILHQAIKTILYVPSGGFIRKETTFRNIRVFKQLCRGNIALRKF